jgi:hypothetical protein
VGVRDLRSNANEVRITIQWADDSEDKGIAADLLEPVQPG